MGPGQAASGLLEREREVAALDGALDATEVGGDGRVVLIEGPPGIGKTALLGELDDRAERRGRRVLRARGSEMERDFGFGIVRQLFGPFLRSLDSAADRARLFVGPVAMAAAIFGLAEPDAFDQTATEASLYGLFWLVVALAEGGPLLISIDDAHWADTASLRFIRYLAQRLDHLSTLVVLAARPNEPGVQADALHELSTALALSPIRPPLLSEAATGTLVKRTIGAASSAPIEAACHEAAGGNPLLVEAVLAELADRNGDGGGGPIAVERIASMGSARIGAGVIERATRLDPRGPEVVRALAVLAEGADLRDLAAMAGLERGEASAILDGLLAASILADDGDRRFAHPLLRTAVYEAIPPGTRGEMHARAARLLADHGADPEAIAAHLLLCEPGGVAEAPAALEAAAARAAERGAPESVVTYLTRALEEAGDPARRGAILRRLGHAELATRDPTALEHLQEAAGLVDDATALDIYLELSDALAMAGFWDGALATIELAFSRFGESGMVGLLDLEAVRAASRGYDPAGAELYARDLPRLLALVRGRTDEDSRQLRWVLTGLGAIGEMPRGEVIDLASPGTSGWSVHHRGRESSLVFQAALGLVLVDALDESEGIAELFEEDARRRGSSMAMIGAICLRAAIDQRRGRLESAEQNLLLAIDLVQRNELSLMALTTVLHFCLEAIVERPDLDSVADLVVGLEVPSPFGETASGAYVHETRAAVLMARGDRPGAVAALRAVEATMRPVRIGPRQSSWRSRLALALPAAEREEALALAEEELRLAVAVASPRAEGIALRALGLLADRKEAVDLLERSVERLRAVESPHEAARSLTELGAALARTNRRREARERLREASDLAQRCGAARLEERIEQEIRVAGGKPRRRAISGPHSLTPSERRVAASAAEGATNREIGQMLFISMRTVEMHLTNAYRKLGITSRAELAAAIDA
jgi:DNA-binding CsgD family transcriptional regulator